MKISELQELLERAKEEYGDVDVRVYDSEIDAYDSFFHIHKCLIESGKYYFDEQYLALDFWH